MENQGAYKQNHTPYNLYKNFKVPKSANSQFFDDFISYQPQKDEVFIVTYPKCGTTWVQHIVYLIHSKGQPAAHASDIISKIPFPEQDGFPKDDENFIAIKHHLLYDMLPFSNESKYIYVVRNPLDTCVSYFHFLKYLPGYCLNDIDVFFDDFLNGDVPYGDFFDHLLSWYLKAVEKPNILVLTYEYMMENHREAIKRISSFLGFHQCVDDDTILDDIVRYSKSDFMRGLVDGSNFMKTYAKIASTQGPRDVFRDCSASVLANHREDSKARMIRKGCVGDWKNHLTLSQARRMKQLFVERTKGTEAETLWKDIFQDI